jgi:hypothetical protein
MGPDNQARPMTECSNRGICDRQTGECECFKGYDGNACQRAGCFKNKVTGEECSNQGYCAPMKELAAMAGKVYDTPWDALKLWGCVCNLGYRGPSCESRECPTREDPLGGLGNESGRDCSGRGICDYSTGLCYCFSGFHGDACDKITVLY